jgi:hypothetical protein
LLDPYLLFAAWAAVNPIDRHEFSLLAVVFGSVFCSIGMTLDGISTI